MRKEFVVSDADLARCRALSEEYANERRDAILEYLDAQQAHLMTVAESPIEFLFGCALMAMSDGFGEIIYVEDAKRFLDYADKLPSTEDGRCDPYRIGTAMCAQVKLGEYRADFSFITYCRDRTRILVVECDGHEFHERTKEQAARDKQRDRWFKRAGIEVLRFTGSEIYRDPWEKAQEVSDVLGWTISEFCDDAHARNRPKKLK